MNGALPVLTPAGEWLVGMPSVRHVYREAGLGWLSTVSEVPFGSGLMDAAYLRLARNRRKVSRGMGLAHPDCSATVCRLQGRMKNPDSRNALVDLTLGASE